MFNSLRGSISGSAADALYLVTGGVEWEIIMPLTDIDALANNTGEARVFTWIHHTDKDMRLFGFADAARRATFLELQKVEGIGPRAALKIMSGISQTELEKALEEGNVARLEQVPGLGKKTAQKMVLALKGKLVHGGGDKSAPSPYGELVNALVDMGYDKKAALAALEQASASLSPDLKGEHGENELFRLAILNLAK